MQYWLVTVIDTSSKEELTFNMLAPKKYRVKKIREILKSTHPEFERIRLKRIKRPPNCVLFMDKPLPVPKKLDPDPPAPVVQQKIGFA